MVRLSLRSLITAGLLTCVATLPVTQASAQVDPQRGRAGPSLPAPTAFPAPGLYSNTTGVALQDAEPGAEIHYTWDGSVPTAASPKLDPGQVLFIAGLYEGDAGLTTGYTLRAVAVRPGDADSRPATFSYTIARRDRTAYASELVAPGVRMIRDSDNDKIYLVKGASAYALIDSGMGRGALDAYVRQFTGGLPVIPIFTHSHGDHIGQADRFITSGPEYVGEPDRPAVVEFMEHQGVAPAVLAANLKPLHDGDRIDLGDRSLEIYAVAGHTPGSIVIFDPASGVVNTWVNRLIGDVQPSVSQKITFTAADGKVPAGTNPGDYQRSMRMPYAADAPLVPAGLTGPVRVLTVAPY